MRQPLLWWQAHQFGGRRKAYIPASFGESLNIRDYFDLKKV